MEVGQDAAYFACENLCPSWKRLSILTAEAKFIHLNLFASSMSGIVHDTQ